MGTQSNVVGLYTLYHMRELRKWMMQNDVRECFDDSNTLWHLDDVHEAIDNLKKKE